MSISSLTITHLRNIGSISFEPSPEINIICGPNGSGKTSILEAIFLLGRGRPFNPSDRNSIIKKGQHSCTVFGNVTLAKDILKIPVGVTRRMDGLHRIRISGDTIKSKSTLAELLPLQVISPDAFKLLSGGPGNRRQFLDWGVFHVEQTFHDSWARLNRSLKQRNKLLRHGNITPALLSPWDAEFIEHAETVTRLRASYADKFKPLFTGILARLSDLEGVAISFYPGWDRTKTLEEVMAGARLRDQKQGFTYYGPQRADIKVKYLQHNAADTLSRGQQKLVICAMKLAHGYLYTQATGRACLYLIDDLAAELDVRHRSLLCNLLAELDCQMFLTCVEASIFSEYWKSKNRKMFHVEHGTVEA